MLYTHNWGIFFAAGAFVALAPVLVRVARTGARFCEGRADRLRRRRRCSTCRGCPTLLYQAQHTGAPWLNSPRFGAPVQISKSLLGGGTATVALVLAGGSGLARDLAAQREDRERPR